MTKSYQDFKNRVLGRAYDIDGAYGAQCFDGYAEYCRYLGVPYANCTVTHYVQDIWTQRKSNGVLKYFYEVHNLQPGDVVVFRPCSATPSSHIAIFDADAGGGYGIFLGQNQGGTPYISGGSAYNLLKLPYWATYDTGFRPKSWSGSYENVSSIGYSEKQLINESGSCVLTQPVKKRRDRPDGIVAETLNPGKKLTYTQKWVGNGHRYVSWVETEPSGNKYRYFVAISGSEKHGVDLWANFEEPKPSTTSEHGYAKYKVDGVAIRKGSPTGDKIGQVNSGQVVEYTAKAVTNDHRYIVTADGNWIACSPTSKRSTEWADFYASDPSKTTASNQPKTQDQPKTGGHSVDTSSIKYLGVDLSHANPKGSVDLAKYDFAIIQACYGEKTDNADYKDKLLDYWVGECNKAGIPYGVYCYDYAYDIEGAKLEAEYAVELAEQVGATLGVWIDMEDSDDWKKKRSLLTADHCLKVCQTFCKTVSDLGWYTGVYSSTWWFDNWLTDGLDSYDKWIAAWDANDGYVHSVHSGIGSIHQYSSVTPDGESLDLDAMYVDFDHFNNKKNKEENTDKKEDKKTDIKENENKKEDEKTDEKTDKEKMQRKMIKQIIKILKKMLKL